MSNTIDWGKIHYNSWSPETNLTGAGATPPFSNTKSTEYDGMDAYVDMSNPSNLNFDADDAFSISVWFKRSSDLNAVAIVSKSLGSPDNNGYMLYLYQDKVYFRIRKNASLFHQIISNNTHPFNTWVHYIVTYDGSRSGSGQGLNLYQDGIKLTNVAKSGNFASGSAQTSANFSVGSRESTSDLFFNGKIDEVSVFNSELSASDITSIYNSGIPNDIASLSPLSWWRFEGTGTTAIDSGTGGNDGILDNTVIRSTDVPT